MKSERQHREDICRFGKMIHERGFVAATDGNLSVRLDHDAILSTPTAMSKGMMEPEDLVVVDMQGKKVIGRRNVSSEIAMHLLIYRLRPDVKGIVHAHPPTATGYAAAGIPLNQALISEIVLALGCIPIAQYGTPGTPELTEALEPLVPQYDAILMANHGVVTYGENLLRAYMKMETVEHFARIALVAHQLGRQQLLSQEDVSKLMVAREKYEGVSSAAAMAPGCPVTASDVAAAPTPGSGKPPERITVTREELAAIVEDAMRHSKRRW
ncbi:MAG TPA: class II aldolase/adducin family protein [Terriglobales bacterium]|nr:class II aldolase/adducin family protein [Terriglobales bacterium]